MRILVLSDVHLEFGPFQAGTDHHDVVILAGDIWYADKGIRWAAQNFRPERTLCLAGNHEFYKGEIQGTLDACRMAARETGAHFLENDSVVIDGVRFLGSTLWADFRLNGQAGMLGAMKSALRYVNDFRLIRVKQDGKSRRLIPADVIYFNRASAAYLAKELATPFAGKTVVATHFPPSPRSILERYAADPTAPYYCADLTALIETTQPDLWVHGHTHDSFDYRVGRTRVVCNPRGYVGREPNPGFRPDYVVEL